MSVLFVLIALFSRFDSFGFKKFRSGSRSRNTALFSYLSGVHRVFAGLFTGPTRLRRTLVKSDSKINAVSTTSLHLCTSAVSYSRAEYTALQDGFKKFRSGSRSRNTALFSYLSGVHRVFAGLFTGPTRLRRTLVKSDSKINAVSTTSLHLCTSAVSYSRAEYTALQDMPPS